MDTNAWLFGLLLALLVSASIGAAIFWAVQPVAERTAQSIEAKAEAVADAVQHLQPKIEVQAPQVEWPPLLSWLFVAQTVLIFILTVSNVVDLLKLDKLYNRKQRDHGTKKKHGRSDRA